MQSLIELLPLAAFLVTYYVAGIYWATGALMIAMPLLALYDWLRTRHVPFMHGLGCVLVLVFGSATLLLRSPTYIQWKPTVLLWLLAVVFLAARLFVDAPLSRRLLGAAVDPEGRLPVRKWWQADIAWALFYGAAGWANLLVARNTAEATWVNFKVFGLTAATFVFIAAQVLWLQRQTADLADARGET
ncbi:MAG: inner membrane-spanning protein YciB [Steroidobacteraceae bacterium]